MATVVEAVEQKSKDKPIPRLHNGDRLTRGEFERRYAAMPEVKKAELIEGIVYMSSPVSNAHGSAHFDVISWLGLYRIATVGVGGGDNTTLLLDMDNQYQPDAFLRILETHGGQARLEGGFVTGSPEVVVEVAVSSVGLDLNAKLNVYRRNGVREYVVWRVEDAEIDWFVLRGGQYERLLPNAAGHYQSGVLPGLWLNPAALVCGGMATVAAVAQQGLASPEHAAFVATLQQNRKP